jgi:hypothetical protein
MLEDHLERKTYRKSPGRQYGYDYDPLQSRSERSQTGSTASRSGMLLSQRPDPRRTRQLLRQSIIASRRLDDEILENVQPELSSSTSALERSRPTRRIYHPPSEYVRPSTAHIPRTHHHPVYAKDEPPLPSYRSNSARLTASVEPYLPSTRELMYEDEVVQEAWPHQERGHHVNPDQGIDEDEDLDHETLSEQDVNEGYIYEEDEQLPSGLRVVKKQSSSRRKFLIGAGVLVAGGVGVGIATAQSQPSPKTSRPQATNNTDSQMKQAYDQGFSQGAEQARREIISVLDDIESYTLQGAIDAALLTRTAYDVFVSPVIKFGAELTGDFLSGMLGAFKVARNWLASVKQDNATLAAIQKVLESWVNQAQSLPKQLDAITDTDLDGAQGYLRALQRKIEAEKKALHTPTPAPQVKPSPTPKK